MKNILSQYNKRLDQAQMEAFVAKEGSSNPLWLTLACEELRVFGDFMTILDKIQQLPDDLIRYVSEGYSHVVMNGHCSHFSSYFSSGGDIHGKNWPHS